MLLAFKAFHLIILHYHIHFVIICTELTMYRIHNSFHKVFLVIFTYVYSPLDLHVVCACVSQFDYQSFGKQFHNDDSKWFDKFFFFPSLGIIYEKLTDLSPNCSTWHRRNAVWPTRAVILRGTSKSKYGCSDIFESTRLLSALVCVISEIQIKINRNER